MIKDITNFSLKLVAFAVLLFCVHYYILNQFFTVVLHFPVWTIYTFNAVLVLILFLLLKYQKKRGSEKIVQLFLGLTALKMVLAIVFLLPLFFGKSQHTQLEVINFFIPYFLFLAFETFSLNKFLQKD